MCSLVLGSQHLATRGLEHPTFGLLPCEPRIREIPGSPPPILLGWTAQILSWLRHSRLRASNLWALTLRTSEFARSLDLRHLSSSDGRLRSSRGFTTRDLEHPTFGLLPCEPPSSRDPWISATCPPQMDGSHPLLPLFTRA
jgi:hypothetical protein